MIVGVDCIEGMTALSVEHDVVYPRDDAHRYRLYGRTGDALTVLACAPDPEGIGTAIAQLDADERAHGGTLADRGQIGILDAVERTWLVNPFPKRPPALVS